MGTLRTKIEILQRTTSSQIRSDMKKWLKIPLIGLGFFLPVAGLGAWYALENVLPEMVITPHRNTDETWAFPLPAGDEPEDYGMQADRFEVTGYDSTNIKAFYIPSIADSTALTTLVFVHGIHSCKEHFIPHAKQISEAGINVVLFDLRAHGESEGDYCTYGYFEKMDIKALVDSIQAKYPEQTIGIFGNSLGGAVAIQALAYDERLAFGIIESTFHDLEAVVSQYAGRMFGFQSSWLARETLKRAEVIADFPALEVKPFHAAEEIEQPVLIAHGDVDDRIPQWFGKINFEHLASEEKEWYSIPGAKHHFIWRSGGPEYLKKIIDFVKEHGAPPNPELAVERTAN